MILFLFIHQIEGHVVVPNVMGSALRLHPLLVIFGLLAGAAIYGFVGILVALPFLAACRAAWEFFSERVALEPWPEHGRGPGTRRGRDRALACARGAPAATPAPAAAEPVDERTAQRRPRPSRSPDPPDAPTQAL